MSGLKEKLNAIKHTFEESVNSVNRLMEFDDEVIRFCRMGLEKANKVIEDHGAQDHPSYGVKSLLEQVNKIRDNSSIAPRYKAMLNQCIVLLVSYFATAVHDAFSVSVSFRVKQGDNLEKVDKEGLKLTTNEIRELHTENLNNFGDLIATKKEISFQDTGSIAKAFKEYLDFEPKEDKDTHNIILALACRHVFAHAGTEAHKKTIGQIERAKLRDIKKDLDVGATIQFNDDEIKKIAESMRVYIDTLNIGCLQKT